jgi:hypothetical protein
MQKCKNAKMQKTKDNKKIQTFLYINQKIEMLFI